MMGFLEGLSIGDLESTTYFSTAMDGFRRGEAIAEVRNSDRRSIFVGKSARGAFFCVGAGGWRIACWVDAGDAVAASASDFDAE
jgi:hypothetical protein